MRLWPAFCPAQKHINKLIGMPKPVINRFLKQRRGLFLSVLVTFLARFACTVSAQTPLPDSFNPKIDRSGGGFVGHMVLQPDGKILLGGSFTSVNGQPHTNIVRLNGDGTLDDGFRLEAAISPNWGVEGLALQADLKILVGGWVTITNGLSGNIYDLVRLNPDSTIDSGFNPGSSGMSW